MNRSVVTVDETATTFLPPNGPISALPAMLRLWHHRHRTRRQLSMLDDHHLADVGLSPEQRATECKKRFWQT